MKKLLSFVVALALGISCVAGALLVSAEEDALPEYYATCKNAGGYSDVSAELLAENGVKYVHLIGKEGAQDAFFNPAPGWGPSLDYPVMLFKYRSSGGNGEIFFTTSEFTPGVVPGTFAPFEFKNTGSEWEYAVVDFKAAGYKCFEGTEKIVNFFRIDLNSTPWVDYSYVAFFKTVDEANAFAGSSAEASIFAGFVPQNVSTQNEIVESLQGANTTASIEFTTAAEFNAVGLPIYWASNGDNGALASWTFELYKFKYNPEYTLAQAPIASSVINSAGDNNPVATIAFESNQPAGTYIAKITLTNPEAVNDAGKGSYLVLPQIGKPPVNPDESKFKYSSVIFNFVVNGSDVADSFYVANPEDVEAPKDVVVHGASFDSIYVNDVLNFGEDDGGASAKLDARDRKVDGSDGSVTSITLRGWIGFEDQDIAQFGYQIGDNDPVFDDSFTEERGDIGAIRDPKNGGEHANAYKIVIDTSGVKGTKTVVAAVKLADGTIVKIDETVKKNGEGTTPNTSFTFVGVAGEEPVPQTGDATIAMFAVVLVAAMGAAVVFAKKRAF